MADTENSADILDASEEESFSESFDSLIEIAQMDSDIHWGVDPLSMGLGEKLYDELTPREKNNIEVWTYKKLGLSGNNPSNKVRFYQTKVNGEDSNFLRMWRYLKRILKIFFCMSSITLTAKRDFS